MKGKPVDDPRWDEMLQKSAEFGEASDCAVRALALVTGESYEMVHYALAEMGRKPRDGAYVHQQRKALEAMGYSMKRVPHELWESGKTPITLERLNLKGRYLVSMNGHVGAYIDGKMLDWTRGRKHHVLLLYKVEKISKKA